MFTVIVVGAANIGVAVAHLLATQGDYRICLIDQQFATKTVTHINIQQQQLNITKPEEVSHFFRNYSAHAIVSCLPYDLTLLVTQIALDYQLHYFDLTEDVQTAQKIQHLAQHASTAFISQCGLAPGFVGIIAQHLMQAFSTIDTVKLRCGALPLHTSNALQYALTWSTAGLINEYGNPCPSLENNQITLLAPLADLEDVQIDGLNYEAFNTSGGLGNFLNNCIGKVNTLNYKTIRYQGHCEKMRFLMQDLRLNRERAILKNILETALPTTKQDVVLIYVSVQGWSQNQFIKKDYVNKFYPYTTDTEEFSAIQMTTASFLCSILDLVLHHSQEYRGFIDLSRFSLTTILETHFGGYLAHQSIK